MEGTIMSDKTYYCVRPGFVAVTAPSAPQIETQNNSGFITIAQYTQLVKLPVVIDGKCHGQPVVAGEHSVAVRGDSLFQPWSKQKFAIDGINFVLCPETEVIAIVSRE